MKGQEKPCVEASARSEARECEVRTEAVARMQKEGNKYLGGAIRVLERCMRQRDGIPTITMVSDRHILTWVQQHSG